VSLLAARSPVTLRVDGAVGRLEPAVEAALYFVCSEGVANAVKHADATVITVELAERDGHASVAVVDDGRGGAAIEGGTGLRGLADRVEALGGRLRLESEAGAGTRLVAELPARG